MPSSLKNNTFLRAALRQPTEYTPVWLMRQAGRYLPEYNATRARAGSFLALAKNPDFATEVTMQPLERFALDAAILFSDILTIPDAMGLGLSFENGEGPKFARPLRHEDEILKLISPDMAALNYVFDAVSQIRKTLDGRVPLIGFSGSPWTLACYMIEGGASSDFRHIKTMLYQRPELLKHILDVNAQAVTDYLTAQIQAGAQAIMIFDTWGGILAHQNYLDFSAQYMQKILTKIPKSYEGQRIPRIVFTKGLQQHNLASMANLGADVVGLDWTMCLDTARQQIGQTCALQGNLDPAILLSNPEVICAEVRRVIDAYGPYPGHIFNLGHGILQYTPPEHAKALIDEVHRYSQLKKAQSSPNKPQQE